MLDSVHSDYWFLCKGSPVQFPEELPKMIPLLHLACGKAHKFLKIYFLGGKENKAHKAQH